MLIAKDLNGQYKTNGYKLEINSLDYEIYKEIPFLNSSGIKDILSSPAHFKYRYKFKNEDSEAFNFGKIIHMAILEKDKFYSEVGFESDFLKEKTNRATKQYKEKLFEYKNNKPNMKHLVKYEDEFMVGRIIEQVEELNITFDKTETTLLFNYMGQNCKARLDGYSNEIIYDIKTATSARPDSFKYSIMSYKYDIQAAFYMRAVKLVLDKDSDFVFIVIEKSPPYNINLFKLSEEDIIEANRKIDDAITLYKICLSSGDWPGYIYSKNDVMTISLKQ